MLGFVLLDGRDFVGVRMGNWVKDEDDFWEEHELLYT